MLSCSSTPTKVPPEAPEPAPSDPIAEWSRTLGLMARSDEDACAGIRQAWALERAARTDDGLRESLKRTPGFRTLDDQVLVHWVELSKALGKSSAETAMVTIGGVAARLRDDCLDARSFVHWMGRSSSFTKAQPCTRDALGEVMEALATQALERECVCEIPEPQAIPRLLTSIEQLDMDPAPWKAWAEGWKACEVPAQATAPATPEPSPRR